MSILFVCLTGGCSSSVIGGASQDSSADAGSADAGGIPDGAVPADAFLGPDAAVPDEARNCVDGDRRRQVADGTCYFGFNTRDTWPNARDLCISHGAHLVRIDSEQENDIVFALARQAGQIHQDWWVGGNDILNEDVWVWLNDTQEMRGTLFTRFRTGEPNGGGVDGEDCMIIESDNSDNEWDDRGCVLSQYPFICERAAD